MTASGSSGGDNLVDATTGATFHQVTEALANVRFRIHRAALDFDREPSAVNLVCVSKTYSAEDIYPTLVAGQRIFGENRVQEAQQKWPAIKMRYPDVELHLIGPLQSNKVKEAIDLFDVIETVDRIKIAEVIARGKMKSGKCPRLYIEINTGCEPQKAGVSPEHADEFIEDCKMRLGLEIEGLMCIPPMAAAKSPHFALLSAIAMRNGISNLSMGMSADFELGIQLGATHVRVGSAIFGLRDTQKASL